MAVETQAPANPHEAPAEPIVHERIYIGGEWVEPTGSDTHEVIDAATEEVIGRIPLGSVEDTDRAVAAARGAFEDWSRTDVSERVALLGGWPWRSRRGATRSRR